MHDGDPLVREYLRSLVEQAGPATDLWLSVEEGKVEGARALKRTLHTLKGEAHMLGLRAIGSLAAALEELVVRASASTDPSAVGHLVLEGLETLSLLGATDGDTSAVDLEGTSSRIAEALESLGPADADTLPSAKVREPEAHVEDVAAHTEGSLRVDAVMPSLHELRRLHGELALLAPQLREAQRLLRAVLAEMDPSLPMAVLGEQVVKTLGSTADIERRLGTIRAQWAANAHATALALDHLGETAQRASLVSVGRLRAQLTRVVRTTASELAKDVALTVEGDAFLDAAIARRLEAALLHALRNAIDHGIETPDERVSAGKPRQGTLTVRIQQEADQVRVVVRDDGRGVDFTKLRQKLGLAEDTSVDDESLIRRLFESGVTTRDRATSISGRGVGLDVVAREVAETGGVVEARSVSGLGFELALRMPTVLRADVVVPFVVGSHRLAFPSRAIERFLRVDATVTTSEGPRLRVGEGRTTALVPIVPMHPIFDLPVPDTEGSAALVLRHHDQRVAFLVDRCESPRAVPFQPAVELAFRSPLVLGVAAEPDGNVRLLLDVNASLERLRGVRTTQASTSEGRSSRRHRVLVVEDAPVARELLVGLLRSFGLEVEEAAHGREGLDALRQRSFDLVLTDVEMPFIGGLEMVEALRKDLGLTHLPVLVLTTDVREVTRRKAASLGVAGFLSKARFVEDELRKLVDRCLERA